MSWQQIKAMNEQRGGHLTEMRSLKEKAAAEGRKFNESEQGRFDLLYREANDLASRIDSAQRYYQVEGEAREFNGVHPGKGPIVDPNAATANAGAVSDWTQALGIGGNQSPVFGAGGTRANVNAPSVLAYRAWIIGGVNNMSAEQRGLYDRQIAALSEDNAREFRALSASTGGSGAYTVPLGSVGGLDTATLYTGGILEACTVLGTDDGAPLVIPTINDTGNTGEQTAENTDVTEDTDPSFGAATFGAYVYDSGIVKAPVQLLTDSRVPIEQSLNATLTTRVMRKANTMLTTGSGTSEPQGIVTGSTLGVTAASTSAVTYEELMDLVASVDVSYRQSPKCGFMLHDSVFNAIRKLKDGDNRYIFTPGEAGEPARILGRPFTLNNDMAQLTSGVSSKVILFGDLSKYVARRVNTMFVYRLDQLYAKKLQIGFLAYQRFDGRVIDAGTHPIKHLKLAAA